MDFKSLLADFKQSGAGKRIKASNNTNNTSSSSSDYYQSNSSTTTNNNNNNTTFKNNNPVDTIYIICPAPHKVTTGGPEALHQLCDMINSYTFLQAYMLYINPPYSFIPTSTHSTAYTHYNAPCATNIITPESNSLCIWPECWTKYAMRTNDANANASPEDNNDFNSDCHIAIWWLSVNNNDGFNAWNDTSILHLYQSEYAKEYLSKHAIQKENIIPLKEYIPMYNNNDDDDDSNDDIVIDYNNKDRDIDIVYNPKKGIHYTDQIIDNLSNTKYTIKPIGHPLPLSSKEVRHLLSNSKIYIDFGPHPGMDRLPREASTCGCIVITNKEGAAAYKQDVPIPKEYKINHFNAHVVCKLIKKCLQEYESRVHDFNDYKGFINKQYDQMKEYVLDFVKLLNNRFGNDDNDHVGRTKVEKENNQDEMLITKKRKSFNDNDDDNDQPSFKK